jgi:predicted O-methyltransferase YrrM
MRPRPALLALACSGALALTTPSAVAQVPARTSELDARVQAFLDAHRRSWRDMNVPVADGQRLYDLVLEHGFTQALEVGTSTGHSAIWIAWALSKTGGRLITIEIDEGRHREALANFEAAGLSRYIDARLADAHQLVPALEGPFDFVFQDADKDWYTRYFEALYPKLAPTACYVAHNVSGRGRRGQSDFVAALDAKSDLTTTFVMGRGSSGMSVSCRTTSDRRRR